MICFILNADAFVMIIGGWNTAAPEDKVSVHSLYPDSNPVPECIRQLNPLPYVTHAAAVGTLGPGKACWDTVKVWKFHHTL